MNKINGFIFPIKQGWVNSGGAGITTTDLSFRVDMTLYDGHMSSVLNVGAEIRHNIQ